MRGGAGRAREPERDGVEGLSRAAADLQRRHRQDDDAEHPDDEGLLARPQTRLDVFRREHAGGRGRGDGVRHPTAKRSHAELATRRTPGEGRGRSVAQGHGVAALRTRGSAAQRERSDAGDHQRAQELPRGERHRLVQG